MRTSSTTTARSYQFTMSRPSSTHCKVAGTGAAAAAATARSCQFKLNQKGSCRCRERTSGTLHLRLCVRGPKIVISGTLGNAGHA